MTKAYAILILTVVGMLAGCYTGITGRVIDAETQQPIEGAVVLVEWTRTHGMGEHWTESYKAAEAISDHNGIIELPSCYSPFSGLPRVVVYKSGYVAWDNLFVFPQYERRTDFEWSNGYIFKMEKFKESVYSRNEHYLFLYLPIADNKVVPKYLDAARRELMKIQEDTAN